MADTCIDVGVGWGTTELQDGFPEASHILVEPNPHYSAYLRALAAENDWDFYPVALSDSDGIVPFSTSSDLQGGRIWLGGPRQGSVEVACTTLDGLLQQSTLGKRLLVKIDVESHEGEVIAGGAKVLRQADVVVVETRPSGRVTSSEIVAAMLALDHQLAGFLTP